MTAFKTLVGRSIGLDMDRALRELQNEAPGASKRTTYVGASEVGMCMRKVVHDRIHGATHDTRALASMDLGSSLEGQSIRFLRAGTDDWVIRGTGHAQKEFLAAGANLLSHPDALIFNRSVGETWVCDVKRPNGHSVTKTKNNPDEVRPQWVDQAIAKAGTARDSGVDADGGILFIQSNSDVLNYAEVWVPFDPVRYEELKTRATEILDRVATGNLPDGEPERGYCGTCPIKGKCPAVTLSVGTKGPSGLGLAEELELEEILAELKPLEDQADPLNEKIKELRDRIKEIVSPLGAGTYKVNGYKVQGILSTRKTFDSKALKAELPPDVYALYERESSVFSVKVAWE